MQTAEGRNNSKCTLGNQEQIAKALKEAKTILENSKTQKQENKSKMKQKKRNNKVKKTGEEMFSKFLEAVIKR